MNPDDDSTDSTPSGADLGLTDTQMSYLIGLSFAIFYTVFGFIIALAADRFNRRNIITAGIVIWSLMTAACGLARGYGQLFFARMGVGFDEGALSPAALSIISDYFPREKLARAISVYSMGVAVGSGIALLVGGSIIEFVSGVAMVTLPIVGELRPWQAAFVIVALPGIPVALLMFTVREPARRGRITGPVTGSAWSLGPAASHFRQHWHAQRDARQGLRGLLLRDQHRRARPRAWPPPRSCCGYDRTSGAASAPPGPGAARRPGADRSALASPAALTGMPSGRRRATLALPKQGG